MASVLAWDMAALAVSEATFGVVPDPAAAQAFEVHNFKTGPGVAVGEVRGRKDRTAGRNMQAGFVEGRVKPLPWSIDTSVKSRAAVDTVPRESALYRAAGMTQTVNGGTSVVYTLPAAPQETANSFASVSLTRLFGKSPYTYEAEHLRGGVVKTLSWTGGDTELMLKAAGDAADKYLMGYSSSVTLADGAGLTLTFANAEEAYRFGLGFYQIENEVIRITARPTSTTATILRAQLSTAGAAHAAQPLRPYIPTLTYAGSPIAEGGTVTCTFDGVTLKVLSFGIDLTTGMDHGPLESGSKYATRVVTKKNELKVRLKLAVQHDTGVSLLGKARDRNTCALTLIQSTGSAGGVVTFSVPYTEVEAFELPDTENDEAIVDVNLRVRDNAGNDSMTITAT